MPELFLFSLPSFVPVVMSFIEFDDANIGKFPKPESAPIKILVSGGKQRMNAAIRKLRRGFSQR